MALQSCRECGETISTEAATCPHCGIAHPGGESGQCFGCGETVTVVDHYCPLCGVKDPLVPLAEARRSAAPSPPAADKAATLKAKGDAISAIGCLLTLFVTVPILIIVIVILMSR